jgi:peroxiredoxin
MWTRRFATAAICRALAAPAAQPANIPRHSPEFAIQQKGGKQVLLSSYRGKVVALIFILTTCPHCQKAIEALNAMQPQYGPKGFQVLASAIEDMAAVALPEFIKRYNPPYPIGFNDRNAVLDYLQIPMMNRLLMPQIAFIDRQGNIRAQYTGDDKFFGDDMKANLTKQVEALLNDKEGAAGKKAASKSAKKK